MMFLPPPAWSQYSILVRTRLRVGVGIGVTVGFKDSVGVQSGHKFVLGKQQAASTRKMDKNHSSIVVLRIRPKFWWMLPMGVRDNHTKYEPGAQRWRPGTGVASTRPPFQNLQFRAKISLFLPKTPWNLLKSVKWREIVATLHMQLDFPVSKGPLGPSNSTICSANRPRKAPKSLRSCAHWPPTAPNQRQTISWATWLKTRF